MPLLAATGLRIVPGRWVGLLGLVPIGFGARGLWRLRGSDAESRPVLASTGTRIEAITFANGADNIVETYQDLPLGIVDAAVIAIAERLRLAEVATLDRRHFSVVKPRHVTAIPRLGRPP